jgi:beta-carotene/zeaxanthin 4-ketolase
MQTRDQLGIPIALAIVMLWCSSLCILLILPGYFPLGHWNYGLVGIVIMLRTVLQTGLFITAHDAMHASIVPHQPRLNRIIGQSVLCLYACLSYDACRQRHIQHHKSPTQTSDPDFHSDQRLLVWYWNFMRQYLDPSQGLRVISTIAIVLTSVLLSQPALLPRLLLFWLLPLILSSMQLFYFGIYRPHRQPATGYDNQHCARSLAAPVWLSFLMCYHFGYHWEHHEYPHLPWYRLPTKYFGRSREETVINSLSLIKR